MMTTKMEKLYTLIPEWDTKMEGILDSISEYLHELEPATPEIFFGFVINEYSRELPNHRLTRLIYLFHSIIKNGYGAKPFQECTDEEKFNAILDIIEIEMEEELKNRE